MRYSLFFRFRILVRRWVFKPFAGPRALWYNLRFYREEKNWIENLDALSASKRGDRET